MQEKCVECGELSIWEQELGSAICTRCGTLSNPSQSVLASHLEHVDTSGHDYSQYWNHTLAKGRSAIKGRNGWNLPGQDKEATHRRNTVQMHDFIRAVTMKLGNPGLASRAEHIFDSAMEKGRYRWGRKAKLTAGASIAIALREAHKADSIRDIAYLLEASPVSLSRSFIAVAQLLQVSLVSADPSLHLPTLQTHLLSLVSTTQPEFSLPKDLYRSLKPLTTNISSVIQTATSLSLLIARLDKLVDLPTAPTACAILVLALEAELETSLPNAGTLAQALGARLGASKRVIMERYKCIYDGVEEWIREVPWLQAHERRKGRSKVAKRVVVARGLKDVVRFQDELWQKRMEGLEKPALALEFETSDGTDDGDSEDQTGGSISDTLTLSAHTPTPPFGSRHPQIKHLSAHQRAVATTSRFLFCPLSFSSSPPILDASGSPSTSSSGSNLFHHLLTVDDASLEHAFAGVAPTRLQKVVALRGGADVDDDELFEEGELEGFLRSEEEMEALQIAFGWEERTTEPAEQKPKRKKRKRGKKDGQDGEVKRTKRIDMDALARVLESEGVLTTNLEEDHSDDDDNDKRDVDDNDNRDVDQAEAPNPFFSVAGDTLAPADHCDEVVDDEEVVGEWRPMSPGGGGYDNERYDL